MVIKIILQPMQAFMTKFVCLTTMPDSVRIIPAQHYSLRVIYLNDLAAISDLHSLSLYLGQCSLNDQSD